MSQDDFSISELRRKREQGRAGSPPPPPPGGGPPPGPESRGPSASPGPNPAFVRPAGPVMPVGRAAAPPPAPEGELPVDPWRVLGALRRGWYWPVLAAVVLGAVGYGVGVRFAKSQVKITLVRQTGGDFGGGVEGQTLRLDHLNVNTLVNLMASMEMARRGAPKVQPPIDPGDLLDSLEINLPQGSDLIELKFRLREADRLPNLANTYAAEIVAYGQELQVAEANRMLGTFSNRLQEIDESLRRANEELVAFQSEKGVLDPVAQAAAFTRQLVDSRVAAYAKQIQIDQITAQIDFLEKEMPRANPYAEQLDAAQRRLATLEARYTDQHPEVRAARDEIEALTRRAAAFATNATGAGALSGATQTKVLELRAQKAQLEAEIREMERAREELQRQVTGLSEVQIAYADLRGRVDALLKTREVITKRQREVEMYFDNARGYFRILAPVSEKDVDRLVAAKKAQTTAAKAAMLGFLGVAGLVVLLDLRQQTLKTVGDVERVTKLRVLATLGDLNKMTPAERDRWAFRAWTLVAGQLNVSANHGMVCGFMSSGPGEGRTTWIKLLSDAASQRGLRVLTVATKPSGTGTPDSEAQSANQEKSFGEAVEQAMSEAADARDAETAKADEDRPGTAVLNASAFTFPAEVVQKFTAGDVPAAHIPLPGWVWNLERRKQWQSALTHWRAIDNLVLLVELPPASVPESVLLAESLPQVVWLVESGKARIGETREQLEMLRHAKCRLVGAVLNREPEPVIKL
jgi:uncharacterized protein involved in exopolysaccharide biosynthesis